MNDRVKILHYKGKDIVYGDFTGLHGEDFRDVAVAHEELSLHCQNKDLLHLINLTKSHLDEGLQKHADEMLNRLTAKGFRVKTAAVGISGIQRIILNALKRDMHAAKTLDEAREWLVQQKF